MLVSVFQPSPDDQTDVLTTKFNRTQIQLLFNLFTNNFNKRNKITQDYLYFPWKVTNKLNAWKRLRTFLYRRDYYILNLKEWTRTGTHIFDEFTHTQLHTRVTYFYGIYHLAQSILLIFGRYWFLMKNKNHTKFSRHWFHVFYQLFGITCEQLK